MRWCRVARGANSRGNLPAIAFESCRWRPILSPACTTCATFSTLARRKTISPATPRTQPTTPTDHADDILNLVRTVDATSWQDNGGTYGHLMLFDDRLIVTTRSRTQGKIAVLLHDIQAGN